MLLKVTISDGMGKVRCPLPPFTLDEKTRPSVFIHDRTDQLKQLEDEGIISVELVTEHEYNLALEKASARLTKKAIDQKRKQLKRIMKTDGKEKIVTGSGLTITVEPGDVSPEELKAEAAADLKELDTFEERLAGDHPVDEIGDFLRSSD